ncbi:MAG TPA: sugar phosphate isomerase/epimerase [Candidatus Latescibacteria bacterium]|nr:sugar phosphate isomerase/epimerase [Candidatus Latescibacterota bacterium]
MDVKLGINACFAVKRWPEPEAWLKIVGEDLGLKEAQFSLDLLDPRVSEPTRSKMCEKINQAATRYGVHIQTTFTGLAAYCFNLLLHPDIGMRMDAVHWFEEAIEVTSMLGAEGTGGHIASLSMWDFQDDLRRECLTEALIESLHHLAELVKIEGQRYFLWEPMPVPRERPCTIDDAKRLYEKVNDGAAVPIVYCIDWGHQCTYSATGKDRDTYAWLEELSPMSPVMHVQQTDGKADCHWPFTKEFNNKGIIEPGRALDAIARSGVKEVVLMLEIIHPFEAEESKVLDDLKESVEYWKKYL